MPEMPDVIGGETITVEWGNDIRDRTVQRYADAEARDTEHATPAAGDLSYLEDTGDVDVYHSGGWRHLGAQVAAIQMLAGGSVPIGWLLCNGQAVSRTTYAALFAVIGTTWGAGNGSTTFNVPDMRGRYPRGVAASGSGDAIGETFGADTLPNHVHTPGSHVHAVNPPNTETTSADSGVPAGGQEFDIGGSNLPHRHDVNIAEFNSGTPSASNTGNPTTSPSTLPASAAVNFIIKT